MTDPMTMARRLAAAGRLSHAYLITGPAGSGKHDLARALTQALVCTGEDRPCGVCSHCKKAAAGIHPDVTVLCPAEGKRDILVDQVRMLRSDAYVRPNEAPRKVYLIDPASSLNDSAQNSLLKVLEEGPAYAAFLLIAEAAGQLLPTVRSRCEQISLIPPVGEEQAPSGEAVELADLLMAGKESALLAHCVALEKLSREEWMTLLTDTALELEDRARADLSRAGLILPRIEHLKKLRSACDFNVGAGHLAGWLCAGTFNTSGGNYRL